MKPFLFLVLVLASILGFVRGLNNSAVQDLSVKNDTSVRYFHETGLLAGRGDPDTSVTSDFTVDDVASTCTVPSMSGDEVYREALDKGRRLTFAMASTSKHLPQWLPPPLNTSPWDGELRDELRLWGWAERDTPDRPREGTHDPCDFGPQGLGLQDAFQQLGLDTRSHGHGGRTVCHYIYHYNSPAVINKPADGVTWPSYLQQQYQVNNRLYTVTGAHYRIAVNRAAGLIAFIDRRSPSLSARDTWERMPSRDELPALHLSSDIAWGFWNRRQGPDSPPLSNIKYFLVGPIVNSETEKIIFTIFDEDRAPLWPGREFSVLNQEAQALLGSPNGRAVAYFLAQHKRQMGGLYFTKMVTLFNSKAVTSFPYALFEIERSLVPDQV